MELRVIQDKNEFDVFLKQLPHAQFLQSWEWGMFQEAVGKKVVRYGVYENDKLVCTASLIETTLPLFHWTYWYCPFGPIFHPELDVEYQEKIFLFFLDNIKKVSQKEGKVFFRCEPPISLPVSVQSFARPRWVQHTLTSVLDLKIPNESLLSNMKQKTRYNIRLAVKKGVSAQVSTDEKDVQIFWNLLEDTYRRHGIRSHSYEYYSGMVKVLQKAGCLRLYTASFQDEVLVAGIFVFYGNTVTYLHGASRFDDRSVMAPYALQWKVISDAQSEGFSWYDFGGIAPADQPHHPLASITRFKNGFGGVDLPLAHPYDVIFSQSRYHLISAIKKIRSLFIKRLRT